MTLKDFNKEEKKRKKFQQYINEKIDPEGQLKKKGSLFDDSDNFRSKVESRQLCELGSSIFEKFGPDIGWKVCLRTNYDFNNKNKIIRNNNSSLSI